MGDLGYNVPARILKGNISRTFPVISKGQPVNLRIELVDNSAPLALSKGISILGQANIVKAFIEKMYFLQGPVCVVLLLASPLP